MELDEHTCPVCGYPDLFERPWSDGSPSDEICPCCGTQFGYDDALGADHIDARQRIYRELRRAWVAAGSPWFSVSRRPPPRWNPAAQTNALTANIATPTGQ
jgi:hypothetical protein